MLVELPFAYLNLGPKVIHHLTCRSRADWQSAHKFLVELVLVFNDLVVTLG